jgi:hypothetical protein
VYNPFLILGVGALLIVGLYLVLSWRQPRPSNSPVRPSANGATATKPTPVTAPLTPKEVKAVHQRCKRGPLSAGRKAERRNKAAARRRDPRFLQRKLRRQQRAELRRRLHEVETLALIGHAA